jgi:ribosomal protein L28
MPIPYTLRIWKLGKDVASNGPLADPKRLGCLTDDLRKYKRIMPTLLHGKKITFGDKISEKGKNRTRRAFFPNIVFSSLYSRALDMRIVTRVSTYALRRIGTKGGFDEYLTTTSPELITDPIAQMYRKKITEIYQGKGNTKEEIRLKNETQKLRSAIIAQYGKDYAE